MFFHQVRVLRRHEVAQIFGGGGKSSSPAPVVKAVEQEDPDKKVKDEAEKAAALATKTPRTDTMFGGGMLGMGAMAKMAKKVLLGQ